MKVKFSFIIGAIILAVFLIGGAWFYFKTSPKISVNNTDFSLRTYTAPSAVALAGLSFSYPSELGEIFIKIPSQIILNLGFQGGTQETSKLKIILLEDNSLGSKQTFQKWVASNYGYVLGSLHNPQLSDDTSVASFTSIVGREALEVEGYNNDPNHSLYLLNLGNGSVLVVAIQGAPLAQSVRDQIVESIKF